MPFALFSNWNISGKNCNSKTLLTTFAIYSKPNEVIIENPRYEHIPIPGVQFGFIGLESRKTWHGSPNVKVRGTTNIVMQSMNEDRTQPGLQGTAMGDRTGQYTVILYISLVTIGKHFELIFDFR